MASALMNIAALVCVLLSFAHAGPVCDVNELMPCLMPLMMYAQSPEATTLQELQTSGREQDITEPQLKSICKTAQALVTCASGFVTRCTGGIPEVEVFTRGTIKLLEVCDRSDLHPKTKLLLTCNKMLNSSGPAYQKCVDGTKSSMSSFKNIRDPAAAMTVLRSGAILKDVCCSVKRSYECLTPEFRKCSTETFDLNKTLYDAIIDAYGCQAKIDAGCPAA